MDQGLITIFFGFLIGISHAFEPDHVVAVSTIVTKEKNVLKAAFSGAIWGLGHTTTLFLIGLLVLFFRINISQQVSLFLELLVGIMLLILGFKLLFQTKAEIHEHQHSHDGSTHSHVHSHATKDHSHHHSFLIGFVHGVAGSGALMLLVLSTISNISQALVYILLFGFGSILGMMITSFLMSWPIQFSSKKFPQIEYYVRILAATCSVGFGLFLIYEIGIKEGLFIM